MKTIKFNIGGDRQSYWWFLQFLASKLGYILPDHEAKQYLIFMIQGKHVTFNPFEFYVVDDYLFINNKNDKRPETEAELDMLNEAGGELMSAYEDAMLSAYESQCNE